MNDPALVPGGGGAVVPSLLGCARGHRPLRAPRAGLLRSGGIHGAGTAGHLPGLPVSRRLADPASALSGASWVDPCPPAARIRPCQRQRRPRPSGGAGGRPREPASRLGPATGGCGGGQRPGRLQLGVRPLALHGPGRCLREQPGRRGPRARVQGDGQLQPHGTTGWSWTSSTTTRPRRVRTPARFSIASFPATTTDWMPMGTWRPAPAAPNTATEHAMMEKLMVDSVPSGPRNTRWTGSASTSWATT